MEGYRKRQARFMKLSEKVNKSVNLLIVLKFSVVIAAIGLTVLLFRAEQYALGSALFLIYAVAYFFFDKKHETLLEHKRGTERLASICADAVKRFDGGWRSFPDNGSDLVEEDHAYASDLDIVGKDSLFQWTNMAATPWGRKALARKLLSTSAAGSLSREEMAGRQQAIGELSRRVNFRHRLKSETMALNAKEEDFDALVGWGKAVQPVFTRPLLVIVIRLFPAITLLCYALWLFAHVVPPVVPILLTVLHIGALAVRYNERNRELLSVFKCSRSLQNMAGVFELLEKYHFRSPQLNVLREKLFNDRSHKKLPSAQIKALAQIASYISSRDSAFYFILNIFLLWDYQCIVSLERWKDKYGRYLESWLEVIAEFEALSSVALIGYDHPDWAVPVFEEDLSSAVVNATAIAHPLMGESCVPNDVCFSHMQPVALITGSNMSGKSTFLRTVGINLVLAYVGAPANARTFSCKRMEIYTCMRVADDLQKNISSFYCEILRVKMIIDRVKAGGHVFFLLDEIFKGTNSADRHAAAMAIIHNLYRLGAAGMVSTHDLELASIEEESRGKVANFHFEEHYEGDKILFDYKLRKGVSTTRNAIFLIKASGIDV